MTTAPDSSSSGTGTTGTVSPSGGTGATTPAGEGEVMVVAIVDGTHLCLLPPANAAAAAGAGPAGSGGPTTGVEGRGSGVDGGVVRSMVTRVLPAVPINRIPDLHHVSRSSSKTDDPDDDGEEGGVMDDEDDDRHVRDDDSVDAIEVEMDTSVKGSAHHAWDDDGAVVVDTGSSVIEFARTLLSAPAPRPVGGNVSSRGDGDGTTTTTATRPSAAVVRALVDDGDGILIHRRTAARDARHYRLDGGAGIGGGHHDRKMRKRIRLTGRQRGGHEHVERPPPPPPLVLSRPMKDHRPKRDLSFPLPGASSPPVPSHGPTPAKVNIEAEGVGSFLVADFLGDGLEQVLLLPQIVSSDGVSECASDEEKGGEGGGEDAGDRERERERRKRILARMLRRSVLTDGRDVWSRSDVDRDHGSGDVDGDGDDGEERAGREGHLLPTKELPVGHGGRSVDDDGKIVRRIRLEPLSLSALDDDDDVQNSVSDTTTNGTEAKRKGKRRRVASSDDVVNEDDAGGGREDRRSKEEAEGGTFQAAAEPNTASAATDGDGSGGDDDDGVDKDVDDGTAMALAKIERGLHARLQAEVRAADDAEALRSVRWEDVDRARDVAYSVANDVGGRDDDGDSGDADDVRAGVTFLPVFGESARSSDREGAEAATRKEEASSSSPCFLGYPLEMVRLRWRSLPGGAGGGGNAMEIEVDVLARRRGGEDEGSQRAQKKARPEGDVATNGALGKHGRGAGDHGGDHDVSGPPPPRLWNVFLSCSQRGGRRRSLTTRSGVVPILRPGQCVTIMASVEGLCFPFGFDDEDADAVAVADTATVCIDAMWSQWAGAAGGKVGEGTTRSSRRGGMALGELRVPLEGVALPSRRFRTIEFFDDASSRRPIAEAVFEYREPRVMRLSPMDYRDAVVGRHGREFWRRLSRAASGGWGDGDGCGGRIELDPDSNAIVVFGDTPERRSDLVRLVLKFLPDSVRLVRGVDRDTTDDDGGLCARARDLVSSISNEIETMMTHRAVHVEKLRTSLMRDLASLQAVTDDVAADLIIRRGKA